MKIPNIEDIHDAEKLQVSFERLFEMNDLGNERRPNVIAAGNVIVWRH